MKSIQTLQKAYLISELPTLQNVIQTLLKPLAIFLIISIGSFFIKSSSILQQEKHSLDDINMHNFTLQSVIRNLHKLDHDISCFISFSGIQHEVNISGGIYAGFFQEGILVYNYTDSFPTFLISEHQLVKVFRGTSIEYDTINITLRIEQKPEFANYFHVYWVYQNPNWVSFSYLLRFASLIFLFPILKYFYKKITHNRIISIKDIMTFILLCFVILYINPISIFIHNQIIEFVGIFFRDLFVSYFYFYFISLFSLMGNQSHIVTTTPLLLLILPYFLFITAALILIKTDIRCFHFRETFRFFPDYSNKQYLMDNTNIAPEHIKIFFSFCIIVLMYVIPCTKIYYVHQVFPAGFIYYLAALFFFTMPALLNFITKTYNQILGESSSLFSIVDYLASIFSVVFCSYGQIFVEL